jgi:hypothetical protein
MTVTAVRLRLCDEDQESFGGPEWITFDDADLDDQPNSVLIDFENQIGASLEFLYRVDKLARTERWKTVRIWMARMMAGVETVPYREFEIKPRKVTIEEATAAEPEGDDADPPSSPSSSEDAVSAKGSARSHRSSAPPTAKAGRTSSR